LVDEGLTTLIKHLVARGDIHGGGFAEGHLQCLTFFLSMIILTFYLMRIPRAYQEASGQEINMTKSEVLLSRNLSMASQKNLSKIMGVRHVLGTGTYPSLSSMVGRSKKAYLCIYQK
jgi:ABC-type amino acid transport system permease subunit